ncbi:MAG: type II toxin-antitoxin system RelE/ParE family toxin [Candidatus Hinthialibacter sp.]
MPKMIFYQEEDGAVPALEWFDGLPAKALDKCTVKLERLEELGHALRRPEADYLRDGIYELRIRFQSVNYRILYFFFEKTAVVISHGLTKEKRVLPREIDKAVERKAKFERSPDKHGYEE